MTVTGWGVNRTYIDLAGGFKHLFIFTTLHWGFRFSKLTVAYFANGLVQPPSRLVFESFSCVKNEIHSTHAVGQIPETS